VFLRVVIACTAGALLAAAVIIYAMRRVGG
jgi:hypothetical protein